MKNLKNTFSKINRYIPWVSAGAYSGSQPGYFFNAHRIPPAQLYLRITEACNYRCKQCLIWTHKDPQDALTIEEKLDIVKQFHFLNPKGIIWLTGGEPLMKLDEFLTVSLKCRELGLFVGSNTNGSFIKDEAIAKDILTKGPNHLLISLDSHVKELHNYTRGMDTSYDQVLRAVKLLIELKKGHFSKYENHIGLICILFEETLPLFKDYVEFCRKLGVDSVNFQLLSKTFGSENQPSDPFYEKHNFKNPQKTKQYIEAVYHQYRNDRFVNLPDIDLIIKHLEDPGSETPYPVCKSHEKNMMVSITGDVQLCFNSHHILDHPFVGNIRKHSLQELWVSERAQSARRVMEQCRRDCGLMNCHRKIPFISMLKVSLLMKYLSARKKLARWI